MKNGLIFSILFLISLLTTNVANGQFVINLSEETIDLGGNVGVDVTVEGFSNVTIVQYSINWDPSVITLVGVINYSSAIPGLNAGNVGLPPVATEPGQMTISWSEPNAGSATVADGTRMFTLSFRTADGAQACDSTGVFISNTPRDILVTDNDLNPLNVTSSPGSVKINGTNCMGGGGGSDLVGYSASMESGASGSQVCVDISVQNFSQIQSFSTSVQWDPTVLAYAGLQNFTTNVAGFNESFFNTTNTGNGSLGFFFADLVGNPPAVYSLNNGEVLFEVCYDIIGSSGSTSAINFAETGNLATDFTNSNDESLPYKNNPGSVTVTGGGGGNEDFTLLIGQVMGMEGSEVCVNVTTENFESIATMQYTVSYNPGILDFVESRNINLPGLAASSFNEQTNGRIRVTWNSFDGSGVNIADGTSLYQMCFTVLADCNSGGSSSLDFINDGNFTIQIVRAPELEPISPLNLQSGSVTVAPCGVSYQVLSITNVLCNGDASGSVSVAVTGASDDCSCVWRNAQGNVVSSGTIGGNNCSLLGQRAGTYTISISCSGQEVFTTSEVISQPAAIGLNATVVNVGCGANGSVALNVSGGTSPYSYNWSNSAGNVATINNLSVGNYSVTVTDANNCTASNSFEIIESIPALAISNASIMDASCNGEMDGAITIEITGGCPDSNGNYTISWVDGAGTAVAGGTAITALAAGSYTVTIMDSSSPALSTSMTYTVGQPTAINVSVASVQPSDMGNNGAILLNVSGGATPYSYQWNPALGNTNNPTGLAPGTYAVTVTDNNGCTRTLENIIVAAGGPVVMNVTATSGGCSDVCEGIISGTLAGGTTPVTLAISGPSSESISLNALGQFSFDELCPGVYTLTVTDANNEVVTIQNLEINEIQPIVIVTETECSESNLLTGSIDVTVTGGTGPYAFQWSTGASSQDLNGVGIGNYSLLVTDANGCEAIVSSIRINGCGGGNCDVAISVITPNNDGFNDNFVINCIESFNARFAVYDRSGIKVFETSNYQNDWGGTNNSGDLLPEGSYMWVAEKDLGNGSVDLLTGTLTILIEY